MFAAGWRRYSLVKEPDERRFRRARPQTPRWEFPPRLQAAILLYLLKKIPVAGVALSSRSGRNRHLRRRAAPFNALKHAARDFAPAEDDLRRAEPAQVFVLRI